MLIALFISCLSDPESTQTLPATGDHTTKSNSSLFLQECSKHQHSTIEAILDRIDINDCTDAFEHLSSTTVLDLSNYPNPFTDISVLAEFTQIEELYINDSQVSDLNPLSQFSQPTKVTCRALRSREYRTAFQSLQFGRSAVGLHWCRRS